jgi:hypothetical protein
MGSTDADGNGYPDACETLLWKSHTGSADPWVFCGTTSQWDPTTLAYIEFAYTDNWIGSTEPTDGVAAGTFKSGTGSAQAQFSGVNNVRIWDATTDVLTKRLATAIVKDTSGAYVSLQPIGQVQFGTLNSQRTPLGGKHIVYFKRTITGFGYDASTSQVCMRGDWFVYGY